MSLIENPWKNCYWTCVAATLSSSLTVYLFKAQIKTNIKLTKLSKYFSRTHKQCEKILGGKKIVPLKCPKAIFCL